MRNASLEANAAALFEASFGTAPDVTAYAPGRVNLLGEHTDYNGGFVLPMPLGLGTAVALGRAGVRGRLEAASGEYNTVETRGLSDAPAAHWTDYIVGSLAQVFDGTLPATGFQIAVAADLPIGSGLSSSAALEVATMRAVNAAFGLNLSPVEIAVRARKAENDFVGVPCGIMDQFSVSVGVPGSALFLDTRKLEHRAPPLPPSHSIVVVHSGVRHKLTEDGYVERVKQCKAACAALEVEMLSDLGLDDLPRIEALPAPLDGRARHIVTENERVLRAIEALESGDTAQFARLMTESHASQRDDYEVSVSEVDALVAGALDAGADGARLTGGGFGGSIVALVAKPRVPAFCETLTERFPNATVLAVT